MEEQKKNRKLDALPFRHSTIVGALFILLVFYGIVMWLVSVALHNPDATGMLIAIIVVLLVLILAGIYAAFLFFVSAKAKLEQMEREKLQAEEENKAKSRFLSNMAHDIRTPLNAIIGFTNLGVQCGNNTMKMQDCLSKIHYSSNHLISVINDVLEMDQIENGRMELKESECDILESVNKICDMFSYQMAEKQLDFSVDTSDVKDTRIYSDQSHLERVLLNLLSNAHKFTPEGGSVKVRVLQTRAGKKGYAAYEIHVKDTGIGMEDAFQEKVFDAFEQERTSTDSGLQGTGLGMAIARNIIEEMHGTIEVISEKDKGTEFIIRVEFRLQPEEMEGADQETAVRQLQSMKGKRILLVDDNMINREIAKEILLANGFRLEEAVSGEEAVEKVKNSETGYYSLVLMDIQMPGIDGYEATRQIRALPDFDLAHLPVIAMTANAFDEDIRTAHEAGMNGHISKPIDIHKMLETITKILAIF